MNTKAPPPDDSADERLPCGLMRFDDAGTLHSINTRLRGWLGCSGSDWPGQQLADLLTPAARLLYETQLLARLKLDGHVDETHLSLRAVDGSALPVLLGMRRAADGPHALTTCVVMRVGDRQQLQDDLQRLQRSAEQIPGVVLQHRIAPDGSSSVPYASDGLHDLFGVTPAQVRHSARPLLDRVHSDDRDGLRRRPRRAGAELRPWHGEFRLMLPDGSLRWIEGRARPQWLADGAVLWHTYLCDATESRRLRDALIASETALRVGQAKSDWLARVSHELRTPLNAVLGFTQVLAADPAFAISADHRQKFEQIEGAGRNLLQLIDEVLELSRIEAGTMPAAPLPCRLLPLLEQAAAMVLQPAEAAGVTLRLAVPPGLVVMADARRLVQCTANLLSNAVKYNAPRGRIDVRVSATGGQATIDVEDTGRGLSAEQIAHLYEPFNRLGAEHGPIEGSGLGLVITRGLLEGMGGTLGVRSTPGTGTCFTMRLPLADPQQVSETIPVSPAAALPEPAAAARPAMHESSRRAAGRALYVEDNPVNAMLMNAIFTFRPELRLDIADSAAQAVTQALASPPDLLLIDMALPDADGTQLLARLREHVVLQQVPAVMVSADVTPATMARAHEVGFSDYWTKPLDLQRTLHSLDILLGTQSSTQVR